MLRLYSSVIVDSVDLMVQNFLAPAHMHAHATLCMHATLNTHSHFPSSGDLNIRV